MNPTTFDLSLFLGVAFGALLLGLVLVTLLDQHHAATVGRLDPRARPRRTLGLVDPATLAAVAMASDPGPFPDGRPIPSPRRDAIGATLFPRAIEAVAPKPWWMSRGVVGPLISALAMLATVFGVEIDPETQGYVIDQVVAIGTAAMVIVGAVVGIWGRVKARRPIGS